MDLNNAIDSIIKQLKTYIGDKKAIIGLSGGIDSSVIAYLCVKALGKDNVMGLVLPYGNQSSEDGSMVANKLGISLCSVNIEKIVNAFPTLDNNNKSVRGNIMARVRMVVLYQYANANNGFVIGTTNKTEAEIGYYCYDEKTRALTTKGLKYWFELKNGDVVFSLNLKTKQLEEAKVDNLYNFDFDGALMSGKNDGINFNVTPNHRMVLQDAHNPEKIFLQRLDSYLENHIHLNIPIPNEWASKKSKPRQLNGFETDDMMYLYGLFIGDGSATHGKVRYKLKALKHKRDKITGRFRKIAKPLNKPVEYNAYTICFAIPENNKNQAFNKLTGILDKYNIKWHMGSFGIKVVTASDKLFKNFSKCGHGALNKTIPRILLSYPADSLRFLFQGLIDSDGDKREYYYTSSFQLATQVVELCFKLGKSASISTISPRESFYKGKKIKSKKSYTVKICRQIRSRSISKRSIKNTSYNGVVWCPEILGYGNLLVERNGSFYFCSNTKYGDGAVDVEPIANLYKTEVWEIAEILGVPQKIIDKKPSAGLWDGQTDEDELGITYKDLDAILNLMPRMDTGFIDAYREYGKDKVDKVLDLIRKSEHKRHMPPSFKLERNK